MTATRWGRRTVAAGSIVAVAALGLSACSDDSSDSSSDAAASDDTTAETAPQTEDAQEIAKIVRKAMRQMNLRGVIVKVTRGDEVVTTEAFGESLDGQPATTDMYFRNGAVSFAYVSTLLLQFVDDGTVTLDDTIDEWMPDLPNADKVTLLMLANQTAGYPDFEQRADWTDFFYADPFASQSFEERLEFAFKDPPQFEPGTNWSYSHTNFMILGEVLAKIGGKPLHELLQEKVLDPMGLTETVFAETGVLPDPVLHSFSSERRVALGIPPTTPFYEESTFWNSDWGTPTGANQATTIHDLITTAVSVGTGELLSEESYRAMTDSNLLGFGTPQPNCVPACFTQIPAYNYGIGVIRSGNWILQNPQLGGYSAAEAYLPSEEIAIAVAVTYAPGAFDAEGNYASSAGSVFGAIALYISDDPPPSSSSS